MNHDQKPNNYNKTSKNKISMKEQQIELKKVVIKKLSKGQPNC